MPNMRENADRATGFRWFLMNTGSWFGAWGMQQVLFSWIVVGELQASGDWVGLAQTSIMLPSLVLLMAGGAVADRTDPRRVLMLLHLLAAIPMLALAALSALGHLDMGLLILYAFSIGTLQAFTMPARDLLLSRVAGENMMRSVTAMTAVQFGMQAVGTLLAAGARFVGSAPMLVLQALIVAAGAFGARFLPRSEPQRPSDGRIRWSEIRAGVSIVAKNPSLRLPVVMVIAVGILFLGPYTVVFPLLVRDYYHGGVASLSLVLMMFPLGTILGSLILRRRGVRRKGLAALWALGLGATAQIVISTGVPFLLMVLLTLFWGLCGAVFINSTRTLFQEAAPALERGRVLSIYQLGFTGGAPLGSLWVGFSVTAVGLHTTLLVSSTCMIFLILGMALLTRTRELE